LIKKFEYHIRNTKLSIEKVNRSIQELRVKINQREMDTKSIRHNIELIKNFEEGDFNTFYIEFTLLIEHTEEKFKQITQKKEKLEFCKFIEKEIQNEQIIESILRET
jgi:hypothetical protein